MKPILLLTLSLFFFSNVINGQVKTNFNSTEVMTVNGKFEKKFPAKSPRSIPAKDIKLLLEREAMESKSGEAKPLKIAEAVNVDIDVVKEAAWVEDAGFAHGKYTIVANGAKSISANFDRFKLPKGTELYVYSANGEMITGPVTENENNENNFWGTWVYKGGSLTIDFKTPVQTKAELNLHVSSVAYGYKELYVNGFGGSAACNINVLCPQGNGWENERNSVALILNASSTAICTGALINNTCNLNALNFLTANHCFDGNSANWKFTFQAWSSTCTPSQNANGTTFNGSTLRARNAASDFCLVELSQMPPATSGITFAGWSRVNAAPPSGVSITHPAGDIMKIASYSAAPTQETFLGSSDWRVNWANGTVEPGSSGGPLFNNDHRVIGQVHGGNTDDICTANDHAFFGRFDLSWTGGGTNSTRLSNWLDPNNTNAMTADLRGVGISGPDVVCSSSQFLFAGQTASWSSSNTSALTINTSTGIANRVGSFNGSVTVTASISSACGPATYTRLITVGTPTPTGISGPGYNLCRTKGNPHEEGTYFVVSPKPGIVYQWELLKSNGQIVNLGSGLSVSILASAAQFPAGTHTLRVKSSSCAQVSSWYNSTIIIISSCSSLVMTAYPNPVSSELFIKFTEDSLMQTTETMAGEVRVQLFNSNQEKVFEQNTFQKYIVIPTKTLQDGVYYLNLRNREGVIQRQILIRH